MIKTNQQVGLLCEELSRRKSIAFTRLSEALNVDESSDLFDAKLSLYSDSLKLIDEAIRYFNQNEIIFKKSDYALITLKQLEDIKAKTLVRVNDLYDLKYKTLIPNQKTKSSTSTFKFKKKIEKSQISKPSDFRVVQHVGLNENNNFEIDLSPEDEQSNRIKRLLLELNVPIKMNKKTSKFIDNYIKDNGGYERFSEEIKRQKPNDSTKPLSFYNKCHTLNKINLIKQMSSSNETDRIIQEEPVVVPAQPPPTPPPPPPPPLPPTLPPPPIPPRPYSPPIIQQYYSDIKSISPSEVVHASPFPTPPPPPPALSTSKILNLSNSSLNSNSNNTNERQNLLESIRAFQGFKSGSLPRQNSTSSSTNNLNRNSDISSPQPDSSSSIIDQLRSELLKRAQFLNDSSDNDNDQDEENDDW